MFRDLYLSRAQMVCYDGEGGTGEGGDGGQNTGGNDGGNGGNEPKTFTQDQLNKILADDKRKHQERLRVVEKQLADLAENSRLTEQDRARLEESLEDVRKQLRTKEEQAAHEKKLLEESYTKELTTVKDQAKRYETLFRESTVQRSLQDAAILNEAFSSQQIVALLRPMAKLVEVVDEKTGKATGQYKTMIDFPDVSTESGESIVTQRSPEDAVKRMKELPDLYGNLFKSGVASGIGAHSATGSQTPGSGGTVDPRKLTPEQYMRLRKENPAAVGLKPKR